MSLEQVAKENLLDVKAAVLSYGGYDFYKYALQNAETYKNIFWWLALSKPRGVLGDKFNPVDDPEIYKAISPIYNIPEASTRKLPPQLLTAATKDRVTPIQMIKEYGTALEEKNQEFVVEPKIRFAGQPGEQRTMFLKDPSGNAIEFKAFKDLDSLFKS